MPLTSINMVTASQWNQKNTITGYQPATQSDSLAYTSAGLDVTVWNQLYAASSTIVASGTLTLDLTSLTNLVSETFSFAHVFAFILQPVGASVNVGPGASNSLQWFWKNNTDYTTVNSGGVLFWSDGVSNTGTVVNGTNKTILITNLSGAVSVVVDINILGSTT